MRTLSKEQDWYNRFTPPYRFKHERCSFANLNKTHYTISRYIDIVYASCCSDIQVLTCCKFNLPKNYSHVERAAFCRKNVVTYPSCHMFEARLCSW